MGVLVRVRNRVEKLLGFSLELDPYDFVARLDKKGDVTFMNFGYVPLDDTMEPVLESADELNRYSIQLYHHLADSVPLDAVRGKDALEVGCGRGGGADYIARTFAPRSYVGLELTQGSVAFCKAHYHEHNLSFIQGDAMALPFGDASFDVVLNVESSHCYPSMGTFLNEVYRVLRPGGAFLFTDSRRTKSLESFKQEFVDAGFRIEKSFDITPNVLIAMDREEARKRKMLSKLLPRLLSHAVRGNAENWAGMKGGASHTKLAAGVKAYVSLILRK